MSLYITTLEEMKAEIGLTDSQDDALVTRWMEGLQDRFEEHLQRRLLRQEDAVEVFDGGTRFVHLARFPVEEVSELYISSDQTWDATTLLDSDDYRLVPARGRIAYGYAGVYRWPDGVQNIRAVYTGGYVAAGTTAAAGQTAMPEAIRRAFYMQLGFELRNRASLGKGQVSANGVAMHLAPAKLLPEVLDSLQPFRRMV